MKLSLERKTPLKESTAASLVRCFAGYAQPVQWPELWLWRNRPTPSGWPPPQ